MNVRGFLYSQIGYDLGDPAWAVIRGTKSDDVPEGSTFTVYEIGGDAQADVLSGPVVYWGETWNSHWWTVDISAIERAGEYEVVVFSPRGDELHRSESIRVDDHLLWAETVIPIAVEQMEERQRLARNGIGWKDCGADWREANSHATTVIALCQLAEMGASWLDRETVGRIYAQIIHGCTYLGILQDAGRQTGAPTGAVVHEIPNHMDIIPGDSAQASVAFGYAARLLADSDPEHAADYSARATRVMDYLLTEAEPHDPDGFSPLNHGVPEDFRVPCEFMTRDIAMMMWGCVQLWLGGHTRYKRHAVRLAREVMARQVPKTRAEGGTHGDPELWGHFYTFDSTDVTEKANTHHHFGHDTGATWPHFIAPLVEMARWFHDHPDRPRWIECVRNFARGYLIPACSANPFYLLPIGYFRGAGLMSFCGPWHGFNTTLGFGAALAVACESVVEAEEQTTLRRIAVGNLQWMCGLNAGITSRSFEGCTGWSAKIPERAAVPYSQIHGVGRRWTGNWTGIRGTIPNGFCVNPQFQLVVPAGKEADEPLRYTDEDWIPHGAGFLSGLVALRDKRRFG
ncbi:MAG: hypothetical protein ACOC0O_06460 [Spirochaetota bacterium]